MYIWRKICLFLHLFIYYGSLAFSLVCTFNDLRFYYKIIIFSYYYLHIFLVLFVLALSCVLFSLGSLCPVVLLFFFAFFEQDMHFDLFRPSSVALPSLCWCSLAVYIGSQK